MVQGTTVTFILILPETVDISNISHMVFSLVQGRVSITKDETELNISGNTIRAFLTQEETLKFSANTGAELQLNWAYGDGTRACSDIRTVRVGRNLYREVI